MHSVTDGQTDRQTTVSCQEPITLRLAKNAKIQNSASIRYRRTFIHMLVSVSVIIDTKELSKTICRISNENSRGTFSPLQQQLGGLFLDHSITLLAKNKAAHFYINGLLFQTRPGNFRSRTLLSI